MNCEEFIRLSKEWNSDVCIFGAGEFGSNLGYEIVKDAGFHVAFYCDNRECGKVRNGLEILPAERLRNRNDDILCIVAVFGDAGDEIVAQLNSMNIHHVFRLAEGDVQWEFAQYLDEICDEETSSKFPCVMDDEIFLKRRFWQRVGRELDLVNPKTFNEKIQWLKIHDRQPLYTILADKYAVKQYVSIKIGEQYTIPTCGVWDSFDEINFSNLPENFVLKCTHDSGSVVFCHDKSSFDYEAARNRIQIALSKNYFWLDREWSYYGVPRRIIAEEFLSLNESDELPIDYKVHCFHGEPKYIQTIADRNILMHTAKQNIYDFNWNLLSWGFGDYPEYPKGFDMPPCLNEMYDICKHLSKGIKYVRIDFYIIGEQLKFGEFTFYPAGGYYVHNEYWTEEVDYMLGDEILI